MQGFERCEKETFYFFKIIWMTLLSIHIGSSLGFSVLLKDTQTCPNLVILVIQCTVFFVQTLNESSHSIMPEGA